MKTVVEIKTKNNKRKKGAGYVLYKVVQKIHRLKMAI